MKKMFKKYLLIFVTLLACPFFINKVHAEPPKLLVKLMVNNDCYKCDKKIVPIAIMLHSTATPGVMAEDWYILWNKAGLQKCVHAFLDDKIVCQCLPWDHRGWHCGRARPDGPSGNDTHISFEICEPGSIEYDSKHVKIIKYDPTIEENKEYFDAIWKNAIWLCANLCQRFKINPREIISHQEGHALGIASNHGDPKHWWDYHNRDMDMFRMDVFRELMHRTFEKILEDDYGRKYFLT